MLLYNVINKYYSLYSFSRWKQRSILVASLKAKTSVDFVSNRGLLPVSVRMSDDSIQMTVTFFEVKLES